MPRPLREQVIVITGASSGIGRATAAEAGRRGARVVLAARNVRALHEAAAEVEAAGGIAHAVPTDVAEYAQVERLAAAAVERFGRVDTWVNNAAVALYATVEQATVEELERVIQVNLVGQLYGIKAVLPHLRRQGGGTIVTVGSVLGERAVPLQAAYVAAKHGLKGFTESLRMELERERSGITVTLIEPSSINTPFFRNARSHLGVLPRPMPPVYEPEVVAEAILAAAERPQRDVVVGAAGKVLQVLERINPPILDRLMLLGDLGVRQQRADAPDDGADNLFAPLDGPGATRGEWGHMALPFSPYTRLLELHPIRSRAALAATALGALLLVRRAGSKR
jgi:short-subunit dehydrogenase